MTDASRARDPEKARRAAAHPERPGEACRADPGQWVPVVNPARCEAKADCLAVCPYDVFAIGPIDPEIYRGLGWLARLKVKVHGMKTAHTPRAPDCRACGLCVVACPERAITLTRR